MPVIVERLRIESWAGLRWPVELALHPRRNIVFAPNEHGKSTVVAALRYGLLEPVTANVDRYRPWGSAMRPSVAVQFRTAEGRWRVEKTFARPSGHARLERAVGGAWEPVSDDPAEVFARTVALVTGATVAARRRGRESAEDQAARRGLLYVLWREQGSPPLQGLDMPAGAEHELAEAVGAAVISARDRRLAQAVADALKAFYTPAHRRETGRLGEAAERLREAQDALGPARETLSTLRGWQDRAEAAAEIIAETEPRLAAARSERVQAADALEQARRATADLAAARARLEKADGAWRELRARAERLAAARGEREAVAAERGELAAETGQRRELLDGLRARTAAAEAEVDAARAALRSAEAEVARAQDRVQMAHASQERADVSRRLGEADPLERALAELEVRRRGLSAPPDGELADLRRAAADLLVEAARLEAARVRLRFTAEAPAHAELTLDGAATAAELAAGERGEWEALEEGSLRLPGVGTFAVGRTLESSVSRLRQRVDAARAELGARFAAWGAASLGELEERAQRARTIDAEIGQARARLQGLLPDGRSAAAERLARLDAQLALLRERAPVPPEEVPDPDAAAQELRAGQGRLAEAGRVREGAEQAVKTLASRIAEAESGVTEHVARVHGLDTALAGLAAEVATLERDGLSDTERAACIEAAAAERVAAEAEVARLAAAAARLETAQRDLDALDAEVTGLEASLEQQRTELLTARARAEGLGEQGSYSALVRAEEAAAQAEAGYRGLQARADALALLHDMLAEEQQRARTGLFRPVAERVSELWSEVSGGRYAGVRAEAGLKPEAVVPADHPEAAPPADILSGGAQEQLGTLIRVALAEVVARAEPGDGQCLILDEPLPQSDPVRRRRVLEVLAALDEGVQLVLLACDPRDYAALPWDARLDLAALREQAREAAATREG